MKRLRELIITIALFAYLPLLASEPNQSTHSNEFQPSIEQLISQIDSLNNRLSLVESQSESTLKSSKEERFYMPQIFGATMVYYNYNINNSNQRFAVRNAHLGVRGKVSNSVSYKTQVNLHNLAKVTVLDAFVQYDSKNFNLALGQQWIHITADYDRSGPAQNLFTSRSFGAVFIPIYSSSTEIATLGNRDIGLYGNYTFGGKLPITLSLGAFNGEGVNQISWDDNMNITGRIQIGGKKGFSAGASIYTGESPLEQSLDIYSAEARYVGKNLFVEANYQQRDLRDTPSSPVRSTQTYLLQSYYTIKCPKSRLFDNVTPSFRFDYGADIDYLNLVTELVESHTAGRTTALMHFMFKGTKIRSRFTLAYENVIFKDEPTDLYQNPLLQDRLTVAMTVAF